MIVIIIKKIVNNQGFWLKQSSLQKLLESKCKCPLTIYTTERAGPKLLIWCDQWEGDKQSTDNSCCCQRVPGLSLALVWRNTTERGCRRACAWGSRTMYLLWMFIISLIIDCHVQCREQRATLTSPSLEYQVTLPCDVQGKVIASQMCGAFLFRRLVQNWFMKQFSLFMSERPFSGE